MAVAWSRAKVGERRAPTSIVRDPVVAQATLPRFLSLGDRRASTCSIDNVEGAAGDYTIDLDVRGPVVDRRERPAPHDQAVGEGAGGDQRSRSPPAGVGRADHRPAAAAAPASTRRRPSRIDVKPGSAEHLSPHRAHPRAGRQACASRAISWRTSCPAPARCRCPCRRWRGSTCPHCCRRSTAIPTAAPSRS